MIYEEFKERKNQYDKETDVLESQLKNKMHDIKNKQIVLDSLNADVFKLFETPLNLLIRAPKKKQKENKDKDFNYKLLDVKKELNFHQKEIDRLDSEMSLMMDAYRKSDSRVNQLKEDLRKLENQNKIW